MEKRGVMIVEAYKVSNECYQEKLAFRELAFAKGMDDTRRRVTNCYSDINLDFLDEDDSSDNAPTKDVPALEVRVVRKASNALPT